MKFGRTINELAVELDRQQKAKKDYLLDTRNLIMDADSTMETLTITNDKTGESIILRLNDVAHSQISS